MEHETNSRPFVEKNKKLEDARSSSYLFLIFGIIGFLLLIALWLDLIPLSLATYMKVLYTIVLGALFLIFFVVGIHYTRRLSSLKQETADENQQTEEIVSWVLKTYPLDALDSQIDITDLSAEQLYFERYEKLAQLISEKYSISDENYLDYLIEKIYQSYSPQE